jgi:hypothetical protein
VEREEDEEGGIVVLSTYLEWEKVSFLKQEEEERLLDNKGKIPLVSSYSAVHFVITNSWISVSLARLKNPLSNSTEEAA